MVKNVTAAAIFPEHTHTHKKKVCQCARAWLYGDLGECGIHNQNTQHTVRTVVYVKGGGKEN